MGVNPSARELRDRQLSVEVEGALGAAGLERGALTVEITGERADEPRPWAGLPPSARRLSRSEPP
jgi:hypothetical protein